MALITATVKRAEASSRQRLQERGGSVALCSLVMMMNSVKPNKESARNNFMLFFKLSKLNVKSTCGKEGF